MNSTLKYRGPVATRVMKLRQLSIPIAAGSEPVVLEIDDCTEVYGDNVIEMFPEVDTPCEHPDAPGGQCHFNAVALEPDRCLYCGKRTG